MNDIMNDDMKDEDTNLAGEDDRDRTDEEDADDPGKFTDLLPGFNLADMADIMKNLPEDNAEDPQESEVPSIAESSTSNTTSISSSVSKTSEPNSVVATGHPNLAPTTGAPVPSSAVQEPPAQLLQELVHVRSNQAPAVAPLAPALPGMTLTGISNLVGSGPISTHPQVQGAAPNPPPVVVCAANSVLPPRVQPTQMPPSAMDTQPASLPPASPVLQPSMPPRPPPHVAQHPDPVPLPTMPLQSVVNPMPPMHAYVQKPTMQPQTAQAIRNPMSVVSQPQQSPSSTVVLPSLSSFSKQLIKQPPPPPPPPLQIAHPPQTSAATIPPSQPSPVAYQPQSSYMTNEPSSTAPTFPEPVKTYSTVTSDTQSLSLTLEEDEALGAKATKAAVLYTNIHKPSLRTDTPCKFTVF